MRSHFFAGVAIGAVSAVGTPAFAQDPSADPGVLTGERVSGMLIEVDGWSFVPVLDGDDQAVAVIASRDAALVVGNNLDVIVYQQIDDGDPAAEPAWASRVWPGLHRDAALGEAVAAALGADAAVTSVMDAGLSLGENLGESVTVPVFETVTSGQGSLSDSMTELVLMPSAGEELEMAVAASDPLAPVIAVLDDDAAASLVTALVDAGLEATDIEVTSLQRPPGLLNLQDTLAAVTVQAEVYAATGDLAASNDAVAGLFGMCLRWTSYSKWSSWSSWSCGPWQYIQGSVRRSATHTVTWDYERTATRERYRTVYRTCWNCNRRTGHQYQTETGKQRATHRTTVLPGAPTPQPPSSPNSAGASTCSPTGGTSKTKSWNPPLRPC